MRCLKGVYVRVAIFSNQLLLIFSRNQSNFIGKNYGGFSLINGFLISKTCSNLEAFLLFGPLCFSTHINLSLNQSGKYLTGTFVDVLFFFLSQLAASFLHEKAGPFNHP